MRIHPAPFAILFSSMYLSASHALFAHLPQVLKTGAFARGCRPLTRSSQRIRTHRNEARIIEVSSQETSWRSQISTVELRAVEFDRASGGTPRDPELDVDAAEPSNSTIDVPLKKRRKRGNRRAAPAQWIACASTRELVRAVRSYVRRGDSVAELGSQLREASRSICDAIGPDGRAVLADVSRKFPGRAEKADDAGRTSAMRRQGEEEEFGREYGDRAKFVDLGEGGFDAWRSALFFPSDDDDDNNNVNSCDSSRKDVPLLPSFDVLVVDIAAVAGNDLDLTSISLVREFLALNDGRVDKLGKDAAAENEDVGETPNSIRRGTKCRVVIVKSAGLHSWARRLVHAQRLVAGTASEHIQRRLAEDLARGQHGNNERTPPVVIAAVGVEEYRRAAPFAVRPGDSVLEVGCHVGKTTALLHKMARPGESWGGSAGCLGIDIGPKIVETARKRYPEVPFAVADAWRTGSLLRLNKSILPSDDSSEEDGQWGYDIVYLDIGGLSGSDGLLEAISLITALGNALEPRCIVIKSRCMRRLASSLVPFSELWLQQKRAEAFQ